VGSIKSQLVYLCAAPLRLRLRMTTYPRSCLKWAMRGARSAGLLLSMAIWSGCERHEFPKLAIGEASFSTADLARLEVAEIVSIPFRLRFMSADFDPKKPRPTTVQLQMIDGVGRSHFISAGETIPQTNIRFESYVQKEIVMPDGGTKEVSEVTVTNTKTGVKATLPKGQVVNFPESYAVLRDPGAPGGKASPDIRGTVGNSFSLPSDPKRKYKIGAIKPVRQDNKGRVIAGDVTIELPEGGRVVKEYPAGRRRQGGEPAPLPTPADLRSLWPRGFLCSGGRGRGRRRGGGSRW
jgi:hypothetical protein